MILLFFTLEKNKIDVHTENGKVGNDYRDGREHDTVYHEEKTTDGIHGSQCCDIPHKERKQHPQRGGITNPFRYGDTK